MQWLITGCSSGLGLELARAVLDAGQNVIASSRNPEASPDIVAEIQQRGGHWIALDTASKNVDRVIAEATTKYGKIDVLVNNAGYAGGGVLETLPIENAEQLFATNFFGPIRTAQAVLPSMIEQKSGTVVNVGSAVFWLPPPGASVYAASKFALEGISEALNSEVADFGIRVLIAEPGGMRTSFLSSTKIASLPNIPPKYKGTTVEHFLNAVSGGQDFWTLDPKRVAAAIVKEVLEPTRDKEGRPMLRMPLGKESLGGIKNRAEQYRMIAETFESVALQCDFPE
ncbi:putative short chain oxidoreductase/dehydrogenase [Xylogone sp. PMI_703]|nr:putative short chain oxidoreductase/dehydrogenase [Xylogone sp. PMI_703]